MQSIHFLACAGVFQPPNFEIIPIGPPMDTNINALDAKKYGDQSMLLGIVPEK